MQVLQAVDSRISKVLTSLDFLDLLGTHSNQAGQAV